MKTLADYIVRAKPTRFDNDEFRLARQMLRLPARNHSPHPTHAGQCDRFVLSHGFVEAFDREIDSLDGDSKHALVASAKPLLPQFWIEQTSKVFDDTEQCGWLFDGDEVHCFYGFPRGCIHIGSYSAIFSALDANMQVVGTKSSALMMLGDRYGIDEDHLFSHLGVRALAVVSAIGSRRTAVTRRVIPSDDAASHAFQRRRLQRGWPIFSYNQVDLILPQTCIYRGETRQVASFNGMRGHMVIGHWRLIAGALEPYWIWVDGFERGDRSRGWIVKNRVVQFIPGGERRGFMLPTVTGQPGERRPAVKSGVSQ